MIRELLQVSRWSAQERNSSLTSIIPDLFRLAVQAVSPIDLPFKRCQGGDTQSTPDGSAEVTACVCAEGCRQALHPTPCGYNLNQFKELRREVQCIKTLRCQNQCFRSTRLQKLCNIFFVKQLLWTHVAPPLMQIVTDLGTG